MKQMMMAALLALGIGGMANASVYNWGITSDASLNSYEKQNVYIVLASDWTDTTTLDSVKEAALNGTGNAYAKKFNKTGITDASFKYGAKDISGETIDVVFVQVNGEGQQIHWSDTMTSVASTDTSKNPLTIGASTVTSAAAGGFKDFPGSGDVPEPTSALLMLLGVAGLALRRRQA